MNQIVKYSIIIPHKNVAPLLARCLSSIPSSKDIQVIIVDDDSDPEKVDFHNFPGSGRANTFVFFTKEAKGAGYARNIGLNYATGKWLIFADADDYFNECFFSSIEKFYDSDADVVYFSATSVDNLTLEPSNRHIQLDKAICDYDLNNMNSVDNIKYSNWEPWSKMFKREYIKGSNFLFDQVPVGNDLGFVLKAGHYSKKIEVDKSPIYCVTYRKDSLTYENSERAFFNRYKAILRTNRYMKRFNKRHFITSIFPYIHGGMRYGVFRVLRMLLLALKYKNSIIYGSRGYLIKQWRARQKYES